METNLEELAIHVQQLKIREEELIQQLKIREEELIQQAKIREEELIQQAARLKFAHNINNCTFSNRTQMMQEIAMANFAADDANVENVSSTAEVCKSSNSSVTKNDVIQMSKFNSSQLRNGEDQMNIYQLQLNILDLAKDCVNSLGIDWESFLKQEADIVVSIRSALTWINYNTSSMNEGLVQKVFILYCDGFLQSINKNLQIYGVNGIDLETDVEVNANPGGGKYKVKLKGRADVSVGDQGLFPISKNKLLRNTSVIGELKKSFDSLLSEGGVSSGTSQQLAEMLGISGMMRSLKLNYSFLKSFLTDFYFIRLAFRWETESESKYFISSLFETPKEFVSCLVFIIFEHSASDINQYVNKEIVLEAVEDDNYVQDGGSESDDLSYRRNLQFDIENTIPPDTNEQYGFQRQLQFGSNNIILMDEYDRLEKKKLYVDRLERFDAARFGFLSLTAENLKNL